MKKIFIILSFLLLSCEESEIKEIPRNTDLQIEMKESVRKVMNLNEVKKMNQMDLSQLIVLSALMRNLSLNDLLSLDRFYEIECMNLECSIDEKRRKQ